MSVKLCLPKTNQSLGKTIPFLCSIDLFNTSSLSQLLLNLHRSFALFTVCVTSAAFEFDLGQEICFESERQFYIQLIF